MRLADKINKINQVLSNYFKHNPKEQLIPAKDLMPQFINIGIFNKDYSSGLPIRNLLRDLDKEHNLNKIPFVYADRKETNTNWFFVRSKDENIKTQITTTTKNLNNTNNEIVLNDLLKPDLDIVFCGTAVGNTSARKKLYYAGSGNQFYSILSKTKLSQRELITTEYTKLLDYNLGLTDIAKQASGNDDDLSKSDFDVRGFTNKIIKHQPKIVCFNGKGAAAVFLYNDLKKTKKIDYGFLNQKIGKTRLFVAPSTSSQAKAYWNEDYWFMLKNEINNA